jgi:hypothetical protein
MEKIDDFQKVKILYEVQEISAQNQNSPSDRAWF